MGKTSSQGVKMSLCGSQQMLQILARVPLPGGKGKREAYFVIFFGLLLFVSAWSVISEFLSVLLHGFIDYILKI